jgi:hypothetical protein
MKKKTEILVQLEAAVRSVGEMLEADQALTEQEEGHVTSLSRHLLAAVHGWKRRAGRIATQSGDQDDPTQGRPG